MLTSNCIVFCLVKYVWRAQNLTKTDTSARVDLRRDWRVPLRLMPHPPPASLSPNPYHNFPSFVQFQFRQVANWNILFSFIWALTHYVWKAWEPGSLLFVVRWVTMVAIILHSTYSPNNMECYSCVRNVGRSFFQQLETLSSTWLISFYVFYIFKFSVLVKSYEFLDPIMELFVGILR